MIIKTSYPFMKPPPSARLIRGHRLAQGLTSLWTMAENGGLQVFDLSGNGRNGVFVSSPIRTSGKFGSAIDFDGADDRIDIPNSIDYTGKPSTILLWINADNVTHDCYFFNIEDSGGAVQIIFWMQGVTNAGRIYFSHLGPAGNVYRYADGVIEAGGWHHIAAIYGGGFDSTVIKIYYDGIEVSYTADGAGVLSLNVADGNFIIAGRTADNNRNFNGKIDNLSHYNRALSPSEIVEAMYNPFCMLERRARTALMSGYEVVVPPVGMAGAMTTNTGYWGW